jgi:hypothetical protein
VSEYCGLLYNIFLQEEVDDKWDWQLDPNKGYTVCGVYNMLTNVDELSRYKFTNISGQKAAPLKVTLFG